METRILKQTKYSVIILGSGISGLYTALKLSKKLKPEEKILIITKAPLGESNSRYAQGGIACVLSANSNDNINLHVNDTLNAGNGLCEEEIVREISSSSEEVIKDLEANGIIFDKDSNGEYSYSLAGAHSAKRVLHCCQDATGKGMIDALIQAVKNTQNICILEKTIATELLTTTNNECVGAIIYNKNSETHEVVFSSNVIIATGGIGQLYKHTTNPYGATGDGIALAYEAGAEIQDMEFIQFHPTSLVINPANRNRFLISETVRGEGAKLLNTSDENFMYKYSDKGELASRDIVTRAIFSEINQTGIPYVYLDISDMGADKFTKRFPHIARKCELNGIDISKNLIPVAPAAHYVMGGIKVNINGETNIKGLYATGEAATNGFHGANRLACNSLLECVVCGYKLADNIVLKDFDTSKISDEQVTETIQIYSCDTDCEIFNDKELKDTLRDIMWNNVGIIRNENSLNEAQKQISELKTKFERNKKCLTIGEYEYKNMLIVAELVTTSAIKRQESRGSHFRSDYPETKAEIAHTKICKK